MVIVEIVNATVTKSEWGQFWIYCKLHYNFIVIMLL